MMIRLCKNCSNELDLNENSLCRNCSKGIIADRYWLDPQSELKKKRNELISLISKENRIIESCNALIRTYQKELEKITKSIYGGKS